MKKIVFWLVKIVLALSVLSYIIFKHKSTFFENIKNFELKYLFFAVMLLVIQMAVCGFRWHALLKVQNVDISILDVQLLNFKSFFLSLVIPGGVIGGDMAKITMISAKMPKGSRLEPNFSILIDRIIGMIGLFLITIIVIFCSFNLLLEVDLSMLKIPKSLNLWGILVILGGCFLGILISMMIFFHRFFEKISIINTLFNKLDKLTHGMINRSKNAIDVYAQNYNVLIIWTLVSVFFVHLMVFVIAWVLALGLGLEIPSIMALLSAVILGSVAGLLPLTPSGLGMRDFVMLVILQAALFPDSAAIPILMSLVIIISNLLGGIAFFIPEPKDVKIDEK